MILFPTRSKSGARGFSLVEVTLAIGITAVALVSLMGMLPKGMQTLQKANDLAVMGRIHQQILGELQLTPWESTMGGAPIDSFDGMVRYYDDQGIELAPADKGSFAHVYTARITIPRQGGKLPQSVGGGNHGGVKVPGEQSMLDVGSAEDFMRLVIVEVTGITDPRFLEGLPATFDSAEALSGIRVYRTVVAKMGQEYENN